MLANATPHSTKALRSRSQRQHWRMIVPLVLPLLISACGGDSPNSQQQEPITVVEPNYIEGQIVEALSANDQPVANAAVTLLFNGSTVQSDSDGRYRMELTDELPIAQNFLALSVSAQGYRPRER